MLRLLSRFLRALFQFSKRAAGEATKFGRSGVKLLGVVGAARLECGEPAAESGELIRRQLGNSFGDFFDFHGAHLSTTWRVIQNIRVARERPARGVSKHTQLMSAFGSKADIPPTWSDVCSRPKADMLPVSRKLEADLSASRFGSSSETTGL